jgi:hypothetical protein
MNTHVVSKSFEGEGGRKYEAGEMVEASGWRNTTLMVTHRYLRPLTPDELESAGAERRRGPKARNGEGMNNGNQSAQ